MVYRTERNYENLNKGIFPALGGSTSPSCGPN